MNRGKRRGRGCSARGRLADEPFHRGDYLLDRPFGAQHLGRTRLQRPGSAFQAASPGERQRRKAVRPFEQFVPILIRQIEVDHHASEFPARVVQDALRLGERPRMDAAQARSPSEQERQTLEDQGVVPDEQQPFDQRTTARIVWLREVAGPVWKEGR